MSKARGFGLPKHNLALLNHTACCWYALPVLLPTAVCPFFFFHREIVRFSLSALTAWQTAFAPPAAASFLSAGWTFGIGSRSSLCVRCTGVRHHAHANRIPFVWLVWLYVRLRHYPKGSVSFHTRLTGIMLYPHWRSSSG